MRKHLLLQIALFIFFCICVNSVIAQPMWTINLLDSSKRSEKFVERKLGSEKMAEKKFTVVRHFFQNNYTHFNYYYNANNKINAVIERAKVSQKDDYSHLLSFYPYSLDNTASQKSELDSVIYKSTAGILLHDLRNDWIDNMYLLMGKAYFLKKDFDSAAATFQFINYNLFPRKKNEDDNRIVGTGDDANNSTLSIANKEKRNLLKRMTAQPPSRNDALVWIARTLIEQGELGEAAGLLNTLQHDPNLPRRLQDDLEEVNAYWFFKQNSYDSAALHLEKALSNAETKQDKSRAEFLLAQLYEATHQNDKASVYYIKASKHTADALLDIYAQLNNARLMKSSDPKELDNSISKLLHMSKKDKFDAYRDILFYAAGELAMQKPDTNTALSYYKKSLKYNENNIGYKNKTFLQLADIAYTRKQYKEAAAYYDSLQVNDSSLSSRRSQIETRKKGLLKIVEKINIIEREDSVQIIAAMSPADRDVFIKKMVKRLRKTKGLKEEEDNNAGLAMISFDSKKDEPVDLFNNNSKGEWYFYNTSLKAKGLADFKRKWGTRNNVDNWRRKSASDAAVASATPGGPDDPGISNPDDIDATPKRGKDGKEKDNLNATPKKRQSNPASDYEDISYEGLMEGIPLTTEKLSFSNTLLAENLFELGNLYKDELEDYEEAIKTYDRSLDRFPDSLYNGELYLGLYYCYNKLGNPSKAAYYKNLLATKFANSHAAIVLTNPAAADRGSKNLEGTKRYEAIYNLFIEGKFDQALDEKKKADSTFGNNYWSPQLLYIEAVYHIKQRNDSIAINVLQNIIKLYPTSPLKKKAEKMIEVLKKRKEIETYLTGLNISRAKETDFVKIEEPVSTVKQPTVTPVISKATDSIKTKPAVALVKEDPKKAPASVIVSGPFSFNAAAPQNVVMLLNKVDGTYVNESKTALTKYAAINAAGNNLTVTKDVLDKDVALLKFSLFPDAEAAIQFFTKLKKDVASEVSWLPSNKYSFIIISDDNLQQLKTSKDLPGYKNLLNSQYPGRF